MSTHIPIPLSHDELRRMLAEHERYNVSEGKEGQQADLSGYLVEDFDFSGLDLSDILHARVSVFTRCRFVGCDLYGVSFSGSSAIGADFREAILVKAEFYEADVSGACFDGAKMVRAEFIEANLRGATFRHADLHNSTISKCDLTNAIFDGAELEYSALRDNKEEGASWINVKGRSIAA